MKCLLILPLVLMLGCLKPQVQYITVPCPAPPVLELPKPLPIEALTPATTPAQERKLWVETVAVLMDFIKQQEILLDGYRHNPDTQVKKNP